MTIKLFKECRTCGKQEPRGWTEAKTYKCEDCKADTRAAWREMVAPKSHTARVEQALRSDPTRRSLRNQGDDLDPLNPLSLTSPLNPIYHNNDVSDWDNSSHRHHDSHTTHDSGSSYDSGSYDSGSSSGGSCD